MGQCQCLNLSRKPPTPTAAKGSIVMARQELERIRNQGNEHKAGAENGSLSTETRMKSKAKAAVMGAFVADAASMGLHWLYDVGEIQRLLASKDAVGAPEFFNPPSGPFYKNQSGFPSPYGQEVTSVLESVAAAGQVDGEAIMMKLSELVEKGVGYMNSATKKLNANVTDGIRYPFAAPDDDQANGMTKVPVIVARYAGTTRLADKISEAVRAHQQGETAEEAAIAFGWILEKVVLGSSIKEALAAAQEATDFPSRAKPWLKKALELEIASTTDGVRKLGKDCRLPGSFMAPIYIAMNSPSYVDGVRNNIVAGGDNCSRAFLIGSLFGAQDGMDAIPELWRTRTEFFDKIGILTETVLQASGR